MANRVDPDQTAPLWAVCSWSTLLASILNSSVMLGNYLQQTTSAEDIFRCIFFLALLGLNRNKFQSRRVALRSNPTNAMQCLTRRLKTDGHMHVHTSRVYIQISFGPSIKMLRM